MRDTQPTKKHISKSFLDMALKTKSWQPVARNGWIIKFSIYRDNNILLTIISQYTGQVLLRYFVDEEAACTFINFIMELSAEDIHDL
jgi:hypothetical protein